MTDKKLWRNRKERKEWARRLQSEDPGLEVVHPHTAGIDVGNGMHYVAVRPDRDPQPVRRFGVFHGGPASSGGHDALMSFRLSALPRPIGTPKKTIAKSRSPESNPLALPKKHYNQFANT
jgi:hypothetical protein